MDQSLKWYEHIITQLIKITGYSAVVFVVLIFYFLISEGLPTLKEVPISSQVRPSVPSTDAESEETYTARLLKAKKRAEQGKQ